MVDGEAVGAHPAGVTAATVGAANVPSPNGTASDVAAIDAAAIDVTAWQRELTIARQATRDALAASADVEDMIVEV